MSLVFGVDPDLRLLSIAWLATEPPKAHGSGASEETQQCSPREEEEEGEEKEEEYELEEEDNPPIPMKTRLRILVETEREREREQRMPETNSVSDGGEDVGCPSQWNVQQVFSYINSLPGSLAVPRICKSGPGGRALSYQAPLLWNQLPLWVLESVRVEQEVEPSGTRLLSCGTISHSEFGSQTPRRYMRPTVIPQNPSSLLREAFWEVWLSSRDLPL
ncbi:unnamed protein product [Pleuronectes platessa]|uniref:Uncharacterized protein n=1 Tax=Pleuronectes platessa TaxID=8262 RepID=A0A9N7TN76_PLEPL|nr:unnamed protein product [Pleuronectes platessa]